MNNLSTCIGILDILERDMKYWGRHYRLFIDTYSNLPQGDRRLLANTSSNRTKYDFMRQLFGKASRAAPTVTQEDMRLLLRDCFILLILDDFDFDYRETTRDFISLLHSTGQFTDLQQDEWNKISQFSSKDTRAKVNGIMFHEKSILAQKQRSKSVRALLVVGGIITFLYALYTFSQQ